MSTWSDQICDDVNILKEDRSEDDNRSISRNPNSNFMLNVRLINYIGSFVTGWSSATQVHGWFENPPTYLAPRIAGFEHAYMFASTAYNMLARRKHICHGAAISTVRLQSWIHPHNGPAPQDGLEGLNANHL